MAFVESRDNDLRLLKARFYRGIAKISLSSLNFDHPLAEQKHRRISTKNVSRLQGIFRKNGCERLQEENYINAVVDDHILEASLCVAGITINDCRKFCAGDDIPYLKIQSVDCLSGLHRVEAARTVLDDNDQWWVVRLFAKETPEDMLSRMIEAQTHEQRPSDGEIFRKIRYYHATGDLEAERRWWACLENSKPKDLRQLIKNTTLIAAFDRLVDIPGLWDKVQLGALHRLLAMKCDEEMINYLSHVQRTWMLILKHDNGYFSPSIVDAVTAEKVQLLAPSTAETDRDQIVSLMECKQIFPSVVDEAARSRLLENICGIRCLIPTLWTFFENLKFLEPCCDAIKKILGNKLRGSLRRSLSGCYFAPESIMIQSTERAHVTFIGQASASEARQIAYVQLWAFCARHFDNLTSFTPKKETGKAKPLNREPNPLLLQSLAQLATNLGFKTPRAVELAKQNCQSQLALDYLHKANPLDQTFPATLVRDVVKAAENPRTRALVLSIDIDAAVCIERRCGRPFEDDYMVDKAMLFFPGLYDINEFSEVTHAFIRRDLFTQFFGPFQLQKEDIRAVESADLTDLDIDRPPLMHDADSRLAEALASHKVNLQSVKDAADLEMQQQIQLRNEAGVMIQNLKDQLQEKENSLRARRASILRLNQRLKQRDDRRKGMLQTGIIRRRSYLNSSKRNSGLKKLLAPKDQLVEQPTPPVAMLDASQKLMLEHPRRDLIITDSIRRNLIEHKGTNDFLTVAIQHYGHTFDLNTMHDTSQPEIVLLYALDVSLGLQAIRIEIDNDTGLAIEQVTTTLQELEIFEIKTSSQLRAGVLLPGMLQRVNKNASDILQACQARGKCYISDEVTLCHVNTLCGALSTNSNSLEKALKQ